MVDIEAIKLPGDKVQLMDEVVFHIVSKSRWLDAAEVGTYEPEHYDAEGFIHLSRRGQIQRPANLLYRGQSDLILLEIRVDALTAELRYEPGSHGEDELFPHLYGLLNNDAVVALHEFPCAADGSFELPSTVTNPGRG